MSESNDKKVKSLKESLRIREKELLTVFKELDHYRRKCHRLKLRLLMKSSIESQSDPQLPVKREPKQLIESPVNSKKLKSEPPEETSPSVLLTHEVRSQSKKKIAPIRKVIKVESFTEEEEGEITEVKPAQKKEESEVKEDRQKPVQRQPKKSQVTKFLQTLTPSAPPKIKSNAEPDDWIYQTMKKSNAVENKANHPPLPVTHVKTRAMAKNPPKKSVAYNQPYSMDTAYTELTYTSLKQQPIQYTPITMSLTQISPLTSTFKESFEMARKLYSTEYEFNMTTLSVIAETLKKIDPHNAATYLVNEMVLCSYLFSPQDALSFMFGIIKELVGEPDWDKEFLNALRPYFVKSIQEIVFSVKTNRLPGLKYRVNSLQEVLNACFVIVCQQCGYLQLIIRMVAKVIECRNTEMAKVCFRDWPEIASMDYIMQICYRLVVNGEQHVSILQELLCRASNADEKSQNSIYWGFKVIFRFIPIKDAYSAYEKLLWPNLASPIHSFTKILVIKMIAILYIEIEKEGNKKVHIDLRNQLEEILTDEQQTSNFQIVFPLPEQQAAVRALEKIGYQSKSVEKWKKSNKI